MKRKKFINIMDNLKKYRYNRNNNISFLENPVLQIIKLREEEGPKMVIGLYFITFLVSLGAMCTLLIRHKRVLSVAILFDILVTVNSFGRFLMAVAQTLETARLGNLMVYIGSCFFPLIMVKILTVLCNRKLPRWVSAVLMLCSCFVLGLVLTIGHSELFYESSFLIKENGFSYLGRTYGPAYCVFPLMMCIYLSVIGYLLYKAIQKRNEISLRMVCAIVLFAVIISVFYIVETFTHTHFSFLSVGYLLTMLLFMYLFERINMYDMPANIITSIEAMKETGYIEFDSKYRVTGYNGRIRELFPEVETKWHIDEKVPEDDSFLYNEVISWIYNRKENEKKTIRMDDRYYELYLRVIPYNHKPCVGYMLEMVDRTGEMKYMLAIQNYNSDLQNEIKKKTERLSNIRDMMVIGMASMVESRDDSTGDHIKRTYQVMRTFSQHLMSHLGELGITEEFLNLVTRAAPMHDFGKIAIDDAILRKQGRLTSEEYEEMKTHPQKGAEIVKNILTGVEEPRFVEIAVNVAHYHHEKWDGTGYPDGLKGTEIPMEARLMALADAFDAMVSRRCYKEAFSYDSAFEIIENALGTQFDPILGKYFLQCRASLEERYRQWEAESGDEKALQLEKNIFPAADSGR